MSVVSIDGARLRDLSIGGWLAIGLAVFGLGVVGTGLLEVLVDMMFNDPLSGSLGQALLGGILVAFGVSYAYSDATADVETTCASCGEEVRVHSGRDSVDEAHLVQASGPPNRAHLGPLTLTVSRQKVERIYCSGTCADEDARVFVDVYDPGIAAAPEVAD
jgi:hypothetical protein